MSTDIAKLLVDSGAVHRQHNCPCRAYTYGWWPHVEKDQPFLLSGGGRSDLLVDVKGLVLADADFLADFLSPFVRFKNTVVADELLGGAAALRRVSVLRSDGTIINPPEPGTEVVLVDDVMTTGRTLLRAKRLLEANYLRGNEDEACGWLAHGVGPGQRPVNGYRLMVVRIVVVVDRRQSWPVGPEGAEDFPVPMDIDGLPVEALCTEQEIREVLDA